MNLSLWIIVIILTILPILNGGDSYLAELILTFAPATLLAADLLRTKSIKNPTRFQLWFLLWVILRLIVSTLSLSSSVSIIDSFYKFFNLSSLWVFILFSASHLTTSKTLTYLAKTLTGIAYLLSLISIIIALSPLELKTGNINFFYAVYGHNRLAEYLVLVFPLVSVSILRQRSKFLKWLVLSTLLIALMLSFSRLAWLILALGPAIYSYLRSTRTSKHNFRKILLVSAGLVFGILIVSLGLTKTEFASKPLNLSIRLDYYRQAWDRWQARPWLGLGPGTFLYINQDKLTDSRGTAFAHNLFLQELNETGILGLAATVAFLIVTGLLAVKAIRRKPDKLQVAAFTGVILSLVHAQFDFGWQIPAVQLTAVILLVAVIMSGTRTALIPVKFNLAKIYWFLALLPVILLILTPIFNRQYFKNRINKADAHQDGTTAELWLNRWLRLDIGNSEMYRWRVGRFLDRGEIALAYDDYFRSYHSPVRSWHLDLTPLSSFLDDYLNSSSQLSAAEMARLLKLISEANFPHDFFWLDAALSDDIKFALEKITESEEFAALSDIEKARLRYLQFVFVIAADLRDFNQAQDLIGQAFQLDPLNNDFERLIRINQLLLTPKLDQIEKAIDELTALEFPYQQKADIYQYMLAYLYAARADLFQLSASHESEIETRRKAIEVNPGLGSTRIELALRLDQLGQKTEAKIVVFECVEVFGPECWHWFKSREVEVAN